MAYSSLRRSFRGVFVCPAVGCRGNAQSGLGVCHLTSRMSFGAIGATPAHLILWSRSSDWNSIPAPLAAMVRGADTARPELSPEAPGLLAASLGLSRMYADDLQQLEAGMLFYDAFYRWSRDATDETHDWPTNKPRCEMDDPVAGLTPSAPKTKKACPPFTKRSGSHLAGVALLSFGGPAGQIAVMHRILVEEKRWISEQRFFHALNYCMLLPGPEAQQLATYIGWLMHGTVGGLIAGGLFIFPASYHYGLSYVYALWGQVQMLLPCCLAEGRCTCHCR